MKDPELVCTVEAGVGQVLLNRPAALNALTLAMCQDLREQLEAWAHDDSIERVEVRGAGERAFCSGADVRWLREQVLCGGDWLAFFRTEYELNALIASYPKPYVAFMSGIDMGGGLGISAHGSRRIVDATSRLAMPETNIGFVPDVGIMWQLSRAPGEIGTHVALTGDVFGAADAVALGLADEFSATSDTPSPAPASALAAAAWIPDCYTGDDPVAIVERLASHPDPNAQAAAATIRARSPRAVAVALAAIRRAATLDTVLDVLAQDLVLARHLVGGPDFSEGVRAQLVDKDRNPVWQHRRLEDVSRAEVLACFVS